jgi:uncharacterized Zn-finger protein
MTDASTRTPRPQGAPAAEAVIVTADQLPAYCPNPAMPLWNHHPRVYLELGHGGEASCPYCGTRYRLAPGAKLPGH